MMRKICFFIVFSLILVCDPARGEIHRPRRPVSGKSKAAEPADLPRLLWEKGQALEKAGDPAAAADEYEELVDEHPGDDLAPGALFRLAVCLQEERELYDSFRAYQRLLVDYPGKGELGEILNRQFEIGEAFLKGEKRDFLFIPLRSGLSTAAEIFRAIVENATFSRIAPRAQYNLGLALQEQGKYDEAELEYELVLKNYSGSEMIGPTFFQLGVCSYLTAREADYDPKVVDRAIKYFKVFIRRFPEDPLRPQAEELLQELIDRKASKAYEIARFYERKGSPKGARIYYQEIVDKYPDSRWAGEAREKLESLPEEEK